MTTKHEYTVLAADAEAADVFETSRHSNRPSPWRRIHEALFGCAMLSMVIASFFLGQYYSVVKAELPSWAKSLHRAPSTYIKQSFQYSAEFGAAPELNNSTEPLWDSLVPLGQGFVKESPDDKYPSALSVVHQLHCLYAIRRKAFLVDNSDDAVSGLNAEHLQPAHLRHCFDYLRQVLLCHADTTLEQWNPKLGGVTGWGTPRICRDYNQIKLWAEERRINDRKGFVEVGQKHHAAHKPGHAEPHDGDINFTTSRPDASNDGDITFTTTQGKQDGDITFTTTSGNDDDGDITFTTTPDGDVTFTTTPDDDITFTTTPDGDITFTTTPDGDITFTTTPDGDITFTTEPDIADGDITFTTDSE